MGGGDTGLVFDGDSVGVFFIGESFAMVSALYSSLVGVGVVLFCDGGVNTSLVTAKRSFCRFIVGVFLLFLVVDNHVWCIKEVLLVPRTKLSTRAIAKVRHAGVDGDDGKSNSDLFYLLFCIYIF